MTPPLDDLTLRAVDAAMAAARVIMEVYSRPIAAETKTDGSPVTEADVRAEAIILEHLAPTGIPVLGEESVSAGRIPHLGDRYFVVDPLDGTKEFLARNGEFTVNIALVENGYPVSGVVLVPVTGAVYAGDGNGAYSWHADLGSPRPLKARCDVHPHRIVASRSHGHAAVAKLVDAMGLGENVSVGSSLKFCLLADGAAELYPRFTPTSEWDTAAGQAVLEAAGGTVITTSGERLAYGKGHENYLNPFFIAAASEELAQQAASEIRRILG